jgi:hypothetical protein
LNVFNWLQPPLAQDPLLLHPFGSVPQPPDEHPLQPIISLR